MELSTDSRNIGILSPQSIDAERSVLGSVLEDDTVLDEIVELLEPRDFVTSEIHQLIWKAMIYQYERGRPSDFVTISDLVKKSKRAGDIQMSYLIDLVNSVPSTRNAKYYAHIVRSTAIRKRGLEQAKKIIDLTQANDIDEDEEYTHHLEKLIEEVRPGDIGNMIHIKDSRDRYIEYLQQKDDFIFTGFRAFDQWMGGIGRGWLYILAGRPSVGKTAKMLQMATGIARTGVGEVCIWSQEMKTEQLINRMIAPITEISANRLRRKELTDAEWDKIHSAYDELEQLPLHVEDAKNVTIEEVKATARRIKRKHEKLAAIIVDYLTIMKIPQQKGETRAQAVGSVTRAAKQIALELDCPFIMLAQLNRESKKEKAPGLEHLKDSGDIEQDADVVEFLWENPEDTAPFGKVVQSTIAKGRDVGTNNFRYMFRDWIQQFVELENEND